MKDQLRGLLPMPPLTNNDSTPQGNTTQDLANSLGSVASNLAKAMQNQQPHSQDTVPTQPEPQAQALDQPWVERAEPNEGSVLQIAEREERLKYRSRAMPYTVYVIYAHVPKKLRQMIWADTYFDLANLLNADEDSSSCPTSMQRIKGKINLVVDSPN